MSKQIEGVHMTKPKSLIERDMVTEIAKAIRAYYPCGLTFEKEWAFCDDERFEGIADAYGKPIRQEICHCKCTAQLVYDTVVKDEISRLSSVIEEIKSYLHDSPSRDAKNVLSIINKQTEKE